MNPVWKIVTLPGDGIGKEIIEPAKKLLKSLEEPLSVSFDIREHSIGGEALREFGDALPEETLAACKEADAILLGTVGSSEFDDLPVSERPESAVLKLRKELQTYCNLRPVKLNEMSAKKSCLKYEQVRNVDFVIVRELLGGFYAPEPNTTRSEETNQVSTIMSYTESEIRRITKRAFQLAEKRKRRLTLVDKANVLAVSRLWRSVVDEAHKDFPYVKLNYMLVDNCAMQLVLNPGQFDVLLTDSLFGDILSRQAATLAGSTGLLPSACLGEKHAVYEPVHGSAEDIAGRNIANPIAILNSVAMMLRYTFQYDVAACFVEEAISTVYRRDFFQEDLCLPERKEISTDSVGEQIIEETQKAYNLPYIMG